jgi:S-adenosyl methyltransferase
MDLSRPVAVMALMILQYVPDEDDPWGIVGAARADGWRSARLHS